MKYLHEGNFHDFLSSAGNFRHFFCQNILSRITSVSNSLDSDQARHSVGPDLGQNCLQRFSADNKKMQAKN